MGGALEVALERVEAAGQLSTVWLEPFVKLTQRFDAQAIEPALSIAANLDEAGVAQHLEVPGHAGLGHSDGVHEFRHRALTAPHDVEEPTASRFGDHVKDGKLAGHPLNIRHHIYVCKHIYSGPVHPRVHIDRRAALTPERHLGARHTFLVVLRSGAAKVRDQADVDDGPECSSASA